MMMCMVAEQKVVTSDTEGGREKDWYHERGWNEVEGKGLFSGGMNGD